MNNHFFLLLIIISILGCHSVKTSITEPFYCGFISENVDVTFFENLEKKNDVSQNEKVDSLVRAIVELSLPYKDFTLIEDKTGEVKTAFAYRNKKGGRYIIFNKQALERIDLKNPNESSVALGVLAHEIGHLLYGHYGRSSRQLEIIADEYSGWVQKKFGVTETNSWLGVHRLTPGDKVNGTDTHPPLNDRKKAVERGWNLANTDSRYRYSVCCDTSFYSSFTVEGLFFENAVNEGNPCFVDYTISTHDEKGEVIQEFPKVIMKNLKINPESGKPIVLFKNQKYVFSDKRFYKIRIGICECSEPCDGKNDERECPTLTEIIMKDIEETLEIPFASYGYLKLRFKK